MNDLAALLLPVEHEGPTCAAWVPDSDDLCEHDSCWDVMTLGGSASARYLLSRASAIVAPETVRRRLLGFGWNVRPSA